MLIASSWWLGALIAGGVATIVIGGLIPIAKRLGLVDQPNPSRKSNFTPTPLVGGVGIWMGLSAGLLFIGITDPTIIDAITAQKIFALTVGGLILLIGGFLDDRYCWPASKTVVAPLLAVLLALIGGLEVSKITNPILGGGVEVGEVLGIITAGIWLLTITYLSKLTDGVDGLTGGVGVSGSLAIILLTTSTVFLQPTVAGLALILLAVLLGFLGWNKPPAKAYLGEGGSTLVGYWLGALAIIAGSKLLTIALVLGLPAVDLVIVIFERIKRSQPIWIGDRTHWHLRLLDSGWRPIQVTILYVVVGGVFGATTLLTVPWLKWTGLLILLVAAVIAIKSVGKKLDQL